MTVSSPSNVFLFGRSEYMSIAHILSYWSVTFESLVCFCNSHYKWSQVEAVLSL